MEHLREQLRTLKVISSKFSLSVAGISLRSVLNIAKGIKLKPYKIGHVQQLLPGDPASRLRFATWCLEQIRHNPEFRDNLVITDEAHCYLHDHTNSQNNRQWRFQSPNAAEQIPLHSPKVSLSAAQCSQATLLKTTILAGVTRNHAIGPVFCDGTITGVRYRELLVDRFFPLLQAAGYNLNAVWFQQDSAPAHTANETIELLRTFFEQRVISRSPHLDENSHWPPRSCDLSSCDFWLWNFVKAKVRKQNPQTVHQLKGFIEYVFENEIPQDMCNRVFQCFVRRLEKCVETGGLHVEKDEILN